MVNLVIFGILGIICFIGIAHEDKLIAFEQKVLSKLFRKDEQK